VPYKQVKPESMKINIVGTTASGKSTFSRKLRQVNGIPYIEMDKIFWGPSWYEPPDAEFLVHFDNV